jgi:mxaA protein
MSVQARESAAIRVRAPLVVLACVLLTALISGSPAHAAAVTASVQPEPRVAVSNPRPFGYVIGDRIEQRITLDVPSPLSLIDTSLPRAGRASVWLQRQKPQISMRERGGARHYELALQYQVVNTPDQIQTVQLPEVTLRFGSAGQEVEKNIAPWPLTISPITPRYVLAREGLTDVRADHEPRLIDTRWLALRTGLWLASLAAIALYFVVSRFGLPFLRGTRGPFARAVTDLQQLARLPEDRSTRSRALQRLHRAFEETAGHAVFAEQLEDFFARHREFGGTRVEAERFFSTSRHEFFADAGRAHHGDAQRAGRVSLDELIAFARRCREAERAAA